MGLFLTEVASNDRLCHHHSVGGVSVWMGPPRMGFSILYGFYGFEAFSRQPNSFCSSRNLHTTLDVVSHEKDFVDRKLDFAKNHRTRHGTGLGCMHHLHNSCDFPMPVSSLMGSLFHRVFMLILSSPISAWCPQTEPAHAPAPCRFPALRRRVHCLFRRHRKNLLFLSSDGWIP